MSNAPPNLTPRRWDSLRWTIDLGRGATNLLGPAPGMKGRRGLWWVCPFHPDRNPSFQVYLDSAGGWRWRCFGCDAHGDAPELVMRLQGVTFPEAVRLLGGDIPIPQRRPPAFSRPPERSS